MRREGKTGSRGKESCLPHSTEAKYLKRWGCTSPPTQTPLPRLLSAPRNPGPRTPPRPRPQAGALTSRAAACWSSFSGSGASRETSPRSGANSVDSSPPRAVRCAVAGAARGEQGQRGARRSPSSVRPAGCGAASARARSRSRSVPAAAAAPPPAPAAPPPAFISPAARRPPRRPLLRRRRPLIPPTFWLVPRRLLALPPDPGAAEARVPPRLGSGSNYPRPFLILLPLFTSAPSQIPFPGVLETPEGQINRLVGYRKHWLLSLRISFASQISHTHTHSAYGRSVGTVQEHVSRVSSVVGLYKARASWKRIFQTSEISQATRFNSEQTESWQFAKGFAKTKIKMNFLLSLKETDGSSGF